MNTIIPINKLEINKGQLEGLPKNPRIIKDARFDALKKSIQDAPEMMHLRELLVYPLENGNYIVIGGNMRLKACQDLGYKELPCKIIASETPVEKLKEYIIKDNIAFGTNDWEVLNVDWDRQQLFEWGLELPISESEIDIDDFFDNIDSFEKKEKEEVIQIVLPNEYKEEKEDIKNLILSKLSDYKGIKVK